jgi:putative ABC transport system permease protein
LTLLTGVIFGIAPAIAAAHTNIQETLKSTGMTHSGGRGRLRRYLVIAELSVSLILLIGAGLLARSFLKLASVDVGFPADHLLTMRFRLSGATYANTALQVQFFDDVVERVEHLPGVTAAAVTYRIPAANQFPSSARFQVEGRPPVPLARQPESDTNLVSRDFFKTLGVPLRAGRIFDTQDSPDSPDAVVINQAFARKIFAGEDPVGKRLLMTGRVTQTWTIVGVVGDIRGQELGANPAPMMYRCTCQGGSIPLMGLMVRTTADPETAVRSVAEQIYSVDRNQPVFDVKTMEQRLEDSLAPQRFQLAVIGGFAALAMAMAAAGVYGMISFFVTRRTREIGIRMALGARPDDVLKLVLGEGLNMAVVAAGIGLIGAAGLTRYVQSLLYGLSAVDPLTYVLMFAALLAMVIAACWGPARRAAGIEPVNALRAE